MRRVGHRRQTCPNIDKSVPACYNTKEILETKFWRGNHAKEEYLKFDSIPYGK